MLKFLPDYLTKLMVSHDLLRSMVPNQIAFDQRDSKSISNFELSRDGPFLPGTGLPFFLSGFQIRNLGYHQF